MEFYNNIDIAIATFPYNGTTTTGEALWMGVPVIALAGETHVSRTGVSILSSVGLPELVAKSPENYVKKTVELALDIKRLEFVRKNVRDKMLKSNLMDAKKFANVFENELQKMWKQWCIIDTNMKLPN